MQQGDGVEVENGLCTGVIAHLGVVARQAEDIVDAEHRCAQKLRLQCDAVAVTASELQDRGQACVLQSDAGGQAAHTHDGGLVIGNIDSGDAAEVLGCFFDEVVNVDSLGRADFCGDNELTSIKQFSNSHDIYSLKNFEGIEIMSF